MSLQVDFYGTGTTKNPPVTQQPETGESNTSTLNHQQLNDPNANDVPLCARLAR